MAGKDGHLHLLRDIALTAGPKIAGGILLLALNLALVFVWPPDIYGRWALCLTLVLLADALIGAPIDLAVVRLAQVVINTGSNANPDAISPLSVEWAAVRIKALVVLLTAGVALPVLAIWTLKIDGALIFASIAALTMLLLLRSALLHLQMRRRFAAYGMIEALHVVLRLALACLSIWGLQLGPGGLMWSLAAAAGLACAFATALAWSSLLNRDHKPGGKPVSAAGALGHHLRWYAPTIALGATIGRLDMLAIGWFAAAPAIGVYGAAGNIAAIPELIGAYLGTGVLPTLVARVQNGRGRPFLVMCHTILLGIAIMAYAVAWLFAAPVLAAVAPPGYIEAVPLLLILLVGTLAGMMTTPLALPLVMLVKKDFLLRVDMVVAPLALVGYWLAIPAHGVFGAAWVAAAAHVVRSAAVHVMAWRLSAHAQDLQRS